MTRICLGVLALSAAGLVGCSDSKAPLSAAQTGVVVEVAPASVQVLPGASVSFSATVTGSANGDVQWSVVEPGGGSIDSGGQYLAAQTLGVFHVVAQSVADRAASAVAAVTVTLTPAVAVAVTPTSASITVGGAVALSATVTGASETGVTWSVQESGGCGSVTQAGLYIAPLAPGTCHVVATSTADGAKSATATVTVTSAPVAVTVAVAPHATSLTTGASVTFSATVTGTSDAAVTWSMQESSGCGSITQAGVYTAPSSARTCHVVARSNADTSKADTATATVTAPVPVTVAVSPHSAQTSAGGAVAFSATVTGSSNTGVTWSVQESSGCGSVTQAGVYTAPTVAATCHVVAKSKADATKSDTATVTVAAAAAITVAVAPHSTSSTVGSSVTFSATVTGTSNTGVTWSVQESSGCGSITQAGVYTASAGAGTCHVVAKSNADATKSDTATITVTVPPPVTVAVSPRTASVTASGALAFSATVTGTSNTGVTWSVQESSGCGSITQAGVYTAPAGAGTCHVVAKSDADATKSDTATVTVTVPVPVTVAVTPHTTSLAAGTSKTFSATVTGTSNTGVTWSVQESSGCGSITQAGVYTAAAGAGTCHVAAKSNADATKSDTAIVTVTALVTVAIAPGSGAVDACHSLTFSATVTGSSNTAVTWSVQEGSAGGTVTSGGVFTAPATAGTYHVVATSQADSTKSASIAVVVSERIVSVAVAPGSTTVAPGATMQFTATVTTTCGSFTATQTLLANGTVVGN